jgi:benzoyl-CoA reductase/2-hydroxyglutaryl-CoA dehydratase subunit BcrC/BadD/HgdB
MDPQELKVRVDQGQALEALLNEAYKRRRNGTLSATNEAFYRTLRLSEYLHPDDFIPLLESFLAQSRGQKSSDPAVVLSGVLPNPPEILSLLDHLGVRVADDDFINCGRRLSLTGSHTKESLEALVDQYFSLPPCTTKDAPVDERINALVQKIEESGAKGVIFYMVKFCEPELFDVPLMSEAVKKLGLPVMMLDVEVNQGLTGQLSTRVEAFVEMIS